MNRFHNIKEVQEFVVYVDEVGTILPEQAHPPGRIRILDSVDFSPAQSAANGYIKPRGSI